MPAFRFHRLPFVVAAFLLALPAAFARPHYIDIAAIDPKKLLAPPSAPGSPETLAEIELIIERQKCRTPADEALSHREGNLSPLLFDTVLGDWFKPENLPLTTALLQDIGKDAMHIGEQAKKLWDRPRPPLQDDRVTVAVGLPHNSSYPSSHATVGLLWGTVLGQLMPDLKRELLHRGLMIGEHRVLCGVHFPSDLEAGRTLARAMLAQLATNEKFQAALAAARTEIATVRPH